MKLVSPLTSVIVLNFVLNIQQKNEKEAVEFLGATKHLYNWLCPLVGWSVGRLVGNAFVQRSTRCTLLAYLALFSLP